MPISRSRESPKKIKDLNIVFHGLLWYYLMINFTVTVSIIYVLDLEGSLAKLLYGVLFFKFLFVSLSAIFFIVLVLRDIVDAFGPGTTYLCGLYFAIFTTLVYYKLIITAWNTNSLDDISSNFFGMATDIGSELGKIIISPFGYRETIYVFIGFLILPTPILGIVAVWLSYTHYCRLTEYVKEERPVPPARKYGRGKSKYY